MPQNAYCLSKSCLLIILASNDELARFREAIGILTNEQEYCIADVSDEEIPKTKASEKINSNSEVLDVLYFVILS